MERLEKAILDNLRQEPEKPCLWWEGEWWSNGDLLSLTEELTSVLKEGGFKAGYRIAALLPNSPLVLGLSLAAWSLGGAISPLNAKSGVPSLMGTLKLVDRNWGAATAGWGEVRKNRAVDNRPLTLNGNPVQGIGTHGVSVIEFELPQGYDHFTAKGVITEGSQGRGSVRFAVMIDPVKQEKPQRRPVSVSFSDLGITGKATVRDLWNKQDLGVFSDTFEQELPLHGAGLYRLIPQP